MGRLYRLSNGKKGWSRDLVVNNNQGARYPEVRLIRICSNLNLITNDMYEWELLSNDNLKKVGVNREDIVRVERFFEIPGRLYTEPGVASYTHPLAGSIGYWIYTSLGNRASIQDTFFHDQGHKRGRYQNIPHWNHERRFIDIFGNLTDGNSGIEYHVIEDSEQLSITFNGEQKVVKR